MTVIALVVGGCAASSQRIAESPDRYEVSCRRSLGNCYEEANNVCPNGFVVIDGAGHEGAVVSTYGTGYSATTVATPIYNGELIVECK